MGRTENATSDRDEEFGAFIRNCASPLHRTAYLLCGDWHLAHDLVQDTLVKAYQHWPPRTQSLLSVVNKVHIPAGFTQVAPPQ